MTPADRNLTPADWAKLRTKASLGSSGAACPFCQQPVKYGERYHADGSRRAHVRCVADALKVPVTR